MQKILFQTMLLSILLLPLPCNAALNAVAKVVALRNTATATDIAGSKRALTSKAAIYEGDTIQTGKRGRIQIIFTDNTIISLGRNANLSIHEYLFQPELNRGALRTEIKEGIFRIMGGAITKTRPENFTTKTPAATIGIRGSMYAGRVSGKSLSVVFQGGRGIFVENDHGRVEIPTPGYGTTVLDSEPPPEPIRFTPQEIDALAPSEALPEESDREESEEPQEASPPTDDEGSATPVTTADQTTTPTDIVPELPPVNETTPPPFDPPPWVPPTTGISHFGGSIDGNSTDTNGISEPISDKMDVFANWQNGALIGSSQDPNGPGIPVIFFGRISGSNVSGITFFGGTGNGIDIEVIAGTGSGSFGGFLEGTLNFTASGESYAVEPFSQPLLSTWSVSGSAVEGLSKPSLTGTQTWKGYVVGLGENMADINTNRHLIRNSDHNDFNMTINKDTGVVSGNLTASDGSFFTSLSIGGTTSNSAYVHDNILGAFLNGTVTDAGTEPIKPHGNYMTSAPLDLQTMEYATWGYWELAYQNPGTSEQYHNHIPGAMWIAGSPTSATDLASLAAGNVMGQYNGEVRGSRIQTGGVVGEVTGTFQMSVDFANLGAASAFTGTMQLDGHTFTSQSISGPADGRFTNGLISGDGYSGDISGTVYGPGAKSIGGNFSTTNGAETYQGIYGGNR